ncbi:hypothetical protein DFH08DRAFT_805166 [Mycena albidolilacea]|uniref:Uncharacterized protein n=1 Tax=Mycena albidolilacea TaxID=1033008 RepID=A0AAD7AAZ7_9AGAR|nr:hypothetical protein DFH08DRAFT_805166 [Mycena albidolilacea]
MDLDVAYLTYMLILNCLLPSTIHILAVVSSVEKEIRAISPQGTHAKSGLFPMHQTSFGYEFGAFDLSFGFQLRLDLLWVQPDSVTWLISCDCDFMTLVPPASLIPLLRFNDKHAAIGAEVVQYLLPSLQSAVMDTWSDTYNRPYGYEGLLLQMMSAQSMSPLSRPPRENYGCASMDGMPLGSANPFMTLHVSSLSPGIYDEPEEQNSVGVGAGRGGGGERGMRLTDSGPVPGPEGGVQRERVTRPSTCQPTSQVLVGAGGQSPQQQQSPNRYSRNSLGFSLPPGAAPPQPGPYTH